MVTDVHAHLYPREFMELLAAEGAAHGASLTDDRPPFLCFEGIRFWRYTDAFHDPAPRLRQMDEAGVDRQVLSLGPPMMHWAPAPLALRLCRAYNDAIARVVRQHGDRFVGFAALPLQDPARSLHELDRAVDLGLRGVGIGSNIQGRPLDHEGLEPFWERCEALGLPLFVHPINPPGQPEIHDYRLDLVVGFPMDTTLAAVRLVYSGVLERHPRLRVCLAHLGGALPFLRERIVIGWQVGRQHFGTSFRITRSPEEYLQRFWLDSVSYYDPAILAGVACCGAERLVMGSDAPFAVGDLRRSVASIRGFAFLSAREREAILTANAEAFLTGQEAK